MVSAKDIVLEVLRRLTVKGGVGKILEYGGEGVAALSVPQRGTITNMLTTNGAQLSENDVYQIVKAIWENRAEWSNVHASVSAQVTLDTALKELSVPMHVGAIKYFKEKGLSIDPSLYPPEYKN